MFKSFVFVELFKKCFSAFDLLLIEGKLNWEGGGNDAAHRALSSVRLPKLEVSSRFFKPRTVMAVVEFF